MRTALAFMLFSFGVMMLSAAVGDAKNACKAEIARRVFCIALAAEILAMASAVVLLILGK